jgi:membrane protein implicated in regulation of membrane protease activity
VRPPGSPTRPVLPGSGPAERPSAFLLALLAASGPFSLFAIVAVAIARGLHGWELGLFAIPFLLAALTVALQGYRLYREPHTARGTRRRDAAPHARG